MFDADVAEQRVTDTHDYGALELRAHPIRIDNETTIERHIDPGNRDLAVVTDSDMHNRRHVSEETAVNCDAASLPRRRLLALFAVAHDEVENAAQPAGVDRIEIKRSAVIWIVDIHRGEIELARIAKQLPQISTGSFPAV